MELQDLDNMDFPMFGGADGADLSSPVYNQPFDFGGYNSSATTLATVSPHDLSLPLTAPNSAAFTNLTSPSIYDQSPAFGSYDPSPVSELLELDGSWKSLFPENESQSFIPAPAPAAPTPEQTLVEALLKDKSATSGAGRRKSSTASPKGQSPKGRHSSVNGVSSRKRDKPLAPIIVENPDDIVAVKRARNTLAARKSRERKADYIAELQEEVAAKEAIIAARDEELARVKEELAMLKMVMTVPQ